MDAESKTQLISQIQIRKIIINIHYVLCVIALWSLIPFTIFYAKGWYASTAVTVTLTIIYGLLGAIRVDGLFKAITPIIIYFLYLLITSIWAMDHFITIKQVLVDVILVVNFGLFFLIGVNNSLGRIANIYIFAAYPAAVAVAAYFYIGYDPSHFVAERAGWTGLFLLPYAIPFCIWKVKITDYRSGLVSLLLTVVLILISKTRASILIATVLIIVTTIALGKNIRSKLAFFIKIGIIIFVLIAGVCVFERPRSIMIDSLERFQGKTVEWANLGEQSEDFLRALSYGEGLKIFLKYQPLGMGYMNFMPWFEKTFGVETSMHSAWLAWGLEGGIICLIIVFYLLYRFYFILYTMVKEAAEEDEKDFYKAMMISMLGVLMNGVVNQAHQGPTLFVLLGVAYSLPYRRNLYSTSH